jgi:uridine monophosphate synthetase
MDRIDWILQIEETGALKSGSFILKNGETSPFYLDLRVLSAHPKLLEETARMLHAMLADAGVEYDVIVGIPYAAVPIATALALHADAPMVCLRKEQKRHGSGGLLVGNVASGARCLVVDDLVTSGLSKREAAGTLEAEQLQVTDIAVVVDRSANATEELADAGYRLHSLVTMEEMVAVLEDAGRLDKEAAERIREFVRRDSNSPTVAGRAPVASDHTTTDAEPAATDTHVLADRIRAAMQEKRSNLILSLDATTQEEFFSVLAETAQSIVMLKTHIDILTDFDHSFLTRLQKSATENRFLILEDRKFADIGNTVRHQFRGGPFTIADWADFVTVHMLSGPAILDGLFDGVDDRGAFLLARMSSRGNLIDDDYTREVIRIGSDRACVAGYIGHGKSAGDLARLRRMIPARQLLLVPGVKMDSGGDGLGQQYLSVEDACGGGADLIIVGRGVYEDSNPAAAAERYRRAAWDNYAKGGT